MRSNNLAGVAFFVLVALTGGMLFASSALAATRLDRPLEEVVAAAERYPSALARFGLRMAPRALAGKS